MRGTSAARTRVAESPALHETRDLPVEPSRRAFLNSELSVKETGSPP